MPIEPEPPRPGRIIVPGAEPEPAEPPRIVLPPGVARETPEDLPEYPRLRPLVLVPFSDGQRELLIVSDPLGVIPGQPVLAVESLAIMQLLDGSLSLNDLTAALMRESKDLRVANMVRDFVAQLDELLMLESPRFEHAYQQLRDDYHRLEIRPAVHEGRSYPADAAECRRVLDRDFAAAAQWRDEAREAIADDDVLPRGIMVPHLDPRRAGAAIARGWLELGARIPGPLRIVVLGTGHSLMGDAFALTRKHFDTPLGRLECDTAFVDAVAAKLGERAWHGELAHRDEHAIEFQALYARGRLGERRDVRIVPVLCGGFHALLDDGRTPRDDEEIEALIAAIRDTALAQGGATLYVASVDLSHVGPRFGDPAPDERTRAEVEGVDREAIEAARAGDADAWFAAIAAKDDATRICGFAAAYVMLRCAEPGPGRTLRYEVSPEPDKTLVSIATLAWP